MRFSQEQSHLYSTSAWLCVKGNPSGQTSAPHPNGTAPSRCSGPCSWWIDPRWRPCRSWTPRQGHAHYPPWKAAARLQVLCRSTALTLTLVPSVPCQRPSDSDNRERVSGGLSFNQSLLFAAQLRYNSLQIIKALHLNWVITGLQPVILLIYFWLALFTSANLSNVIFPSDMILQLGKMVQVHYSIFNLCLHAALNLFEIFKV